MAAAVWIIIVYEFDNMSRFVTLISVYGLFRALSQRGIVFKHEAGCCVCLRWDSFKLISC